MKQFIVTEQKLKYTTKRNGNKIKKHEKSKSVTSPWVAFCVPGLVHELGVFGPGDEARGLIINFIQDMYNTIVHRCNT